MAFPPVSAGRGVSQVIDRCESAKASGFLDLSSCGLLYIADAIYLVLRGFEVTKVSVRDNSLKKFPKKFLEKFPNATIFNIEGNKVAEFPEELSQWTSMRGLNAGNNKLAEFPDGIYSMTSLAILDMAGNNIEKLDVGRLYSSCPSLLQLNLSKNPLDEATRADLLKHPNKPAKLVVRLE